MAIFRLKLNDVKPELVVYLKDPPASTGAVPGPHDLTGATAVKLRIKLLTGSYLERAMVIESPPTAGKVTYQWVTADWGATTGAGTKSNPYTAGGLIVGPELPVVRGTREHKMEYEATDALGPMTFPNESYDTLRVWEDLGR